MCDVGAGVLERDELAAAWQRYRIVKRPFPSAISQGQPRGGDIFRLSKPLDRAPSLKVGLRAVDLPVGIQPLAQRFVHEAYRHGKPIAVAPDSEALLDAAGVPPAVEGIAIGQGSRPVNDLVKNLGRHRFPRRVSVLKPS